MSNERTYAGKCHIYGKHKVTKMILLAASLFGLQFVWGTEQVYFMNYMVSIGLSKTWISLIWLAGPLSGLIVQPVVGAYSDSCTSAYGRRRPFLVVGTVITVTCLTTVGWADDISSSFMSTSLAHVATVMAVVISVFLLDFAVNTVQAVGRAIIVDSLPADEQEVGNAWASRLVAIGHLAAYFMGFLDLRGVLSIFGNTQFKIVIVMSNIALAASVFITCRSVEERILIDRGTEKDQSIKSILKAIWQTFLTLPKRIRLICYIQVLVWHGWFPFLFYSSTWVGEVYARENATMIIDTDDRSRQGALAMTCFSLVTFAATLLVPKYLAIDPTKQEKSSYRLSLPRIWALSHAYFGLIMLLAPFVASTALATILIAGCGFPWAVMSWVPFSLIGEEVSKAATKSRRNSNIVVRTGASQVLLTAPDYYDDDLEIQDTDDNNYASLQSSIPASNDDAGSILGIHNIAICVPQFIISFISSIVFKVLEPEAAQDGADAAIQTGPNAIGVVLAIGGIFALAGGALTYKRL